MSCHQSHLSWHLSAVLLSTPWAATACWFFHYCPLHWHFPAVPAAWSLFTNIFLPWANEWCIAGTQPVFGERMNPQVFCKSRSSPSLFSSQTVLTELLMLWHTPGSRSSSNLKLGQRSCLDALAFCAFSNDGLNAYCVPNTVPSTPSSYTECTVWMGDKQVNK